MSDGRTTMTPPPDTGGDEGLSSIPRTFTERLGDLARPTISGYENAPPSPLEQHLQEHYQRRLDEARMQKRHATAYMTALLFIKRGINPETGQPYASDAERQAAETQYQNWADSAFQAYAKAAGVTKESKGAIGKAKDFIDRITHGGQPGGPGQAPGGRTSLTAPPQASAGAAPGPQGAAPAQMTPPPTPQYTPQTALAEPALEQSLAETQMLDVKRREMQMSTDERERIAKRLDLKGRDRDEFVATGKFPTATRLQKSTYTRKSDGAPVDFDPDDGVFKLADGSGTAIPIDDIDTSTAASRNPKQVFMAGPDGKDRPYWIKGMNVFHVDGTPLDADELSQLQKMHPSLVTKEMTTTTQHLDSATGLLYSTTSTRTTRPVEEGAGAAPATPPQTTPTTSRSGKPRAVAAPRGGNAPSTMEAIQQAHQLKLMTGTTRTMIETAPKVLDLASRVRTLVNQQQDELGPAKSRWAEFMTGKVGAPNKDFAALRTDVGLLQTLLMRMHVGARGGEQMMEHFRDIIDSSKQSPENMLAALDEITAYANEVKNEQVPTVTPANAPSSSRTGVTPPPGPAPKTADDLARKLGIPH